MRILLLRHATRVRSDSVTDEFLEVSQPLNAIGEAEAGRLAEQLRSRGVALAACFTSCFAHAKQTGEIVCAAAGSPGVQVTALCTLTPHYQGPREWIGQWRGSRLLEAITREAVARGNDLERFDAIALVTHQPRLQQLAASMTSQDESRFRSIEYGEGVCLQAESIPSFLAGAGTEEGPFLRRS